MKFWFNKNNKESFFLVRKIINKAYGKKRLKTNKSQNFKDVRGAKHC